MRYVSPLFVLLLFAGPGCVKPPDYPDEPVLTNIQLSKSVLQQESINPDDFLIITVGFTDGDGDIGTDGSEVDLTIIDLRTGDIETSAIKLPVVPKQGARNGISGDILIKLLSTCCIPPQDLGIACSQVVPTDTVSYEIFIKDRAGNESNHLQTDPIILQCQN